MDSSGKPGGKEPKTLLAQTLLDLANLLDSQWERFHRRYRLVYIPWPSDDDLLNWRRDLRQAWKGDDRDVRYALANWTGVVKTRNLESWVFNPTPPYSVVPNYKILALSLAIGVSELLPKLAVCANPECPQPYFFKGRKTQRFCDRPACAAYGQREHKRNWWNEHGQEWKEKQEATRMRRGKHAKAKKV
jgi:hypothetical protein